jgi:hypothetical protein
MKEPPGGLARSLIPRRARRRHWSDKGAQPSLLGLGGGRLLRSGLFGLALLLVLRALVTHRDRLLSPQGVVVTLYYNAGDLSSLFVIVGVVAAVILERLAVVGSLISRALRIRLEVRLVAGLFLVIQIILEHRVLDV